MDEHTENSKTYDHFHHRFFEREGAQETYKHFREARAEWRKGMEGWLPPEVREHGRQARKEMLLAWRSMIDASLERMEHPHEHHHEAEQKA